MSRASRRGKHRDRNQLRKKGLVRLKLDLDDRTLFLVEKRMLEQGKSRDEVIIDILEEIIKKKD